MDDDWFYVTTVITEESRLRPSAVLKSDGTPFELERRKEPIGFILKPTK
jgi:hypothetical protein